MVDASQSEENKERCGYESGIQGVQWSQAVPPEEERLSLEEALLGHTAWGAEALGLEDFVGRLAPGLRADFIELSDSLAEVVPDGEGDEGQRSRLRLSEGKLRGCLPVVRRTWLDGKLVYDAWEAGVSTELSAVEGGFAEARSV